MAARVIPRGFSNQPWIRHVDANHSTKDDPKAGGRQHLISIDWVAYVDQKVHLKKSSANATSQWQVAT